MRQIQFTKDSINKLPTKTRAVYHDKNDRKSRLGLRKEKPATCMAGWVGA